MGTRAPSQSDADWNSWRRWFITVKSLVLLPHESAHANQVSACSSRRWSATLAELVHGSARRLTWQNRSTNLLRHGALSFNDWEVSRSKTIWSTHRPAMRTASNTPATIHQEEICLALNFVGKEERLPAWYPATSLSSGTRKLRNCTPPFTSFVPFNRQFSLKTKLV